MTETIDQKAARLEQEQEIMKVRMDMVLRGIGVMRDGTRVDPEEFYKRDPQPDLQSKLELARARLMRVIDLIEAAYREGNRDGRRASAPTTTVDTDWGASTAYARVQEARTRD